MAEVILASPAIQVPPPLHQAGARGRGGGMEGGELTLARSPGLVPNVNAKTLYRTLCGKLMTADRSKESRVRHALLNQSASSASTQLCSARARLR